MSVAVAPRARGLSVAVPGLGGGSPGKRPSPAKDALAALAAAGERGRASKQSSSPKND